MKINTQKREGNRVFFEVEEDYSQFQKCFESALRSAGKEIKIAGFRPGKAPRNIMEKALDLEAVGHRAAQALIADLYPKIIEAGKIDPVDYPDLEIIHQEKDQPFVFKLSVDVYPEVKLGKYKGLKLEKQDVAISEEEILTVLGRLQERFTGTNSEGKKELLPLDDEFAKKVSKHGTLAELKEELHRVLLEEKTAESEADLKNKAIAGASTDATVDIPPAMTEREIDIMLDELKGSLAHSGLTLEDYLRGAKKEEKSMRDEMKKSAEIRVKGKIVLKAVAAAEKMVITPEEMSAEVKEMAKTSEQDPQLLEKNLGENGRNFIEDYLLRRKALAFITEKAKIELVAAVSPSIGEEEKG